MSTFLYCLKQGVINICRNIWFSLASVATISACIFLFCLFFAMVANVQHGARAAEETVGISVFFDEGMDEEQIRSIWITDTKLERSAGSKVYIRRGSMGVL